MIRNNQNAFIFSPILLLVLTLITGCNQNKIIDEDKFIVIYSDLIIAKDTTSSQLQSSDAILKKILARNKIELADYKATVDYYNQDSQRWESFFSKTIAYLEKKRKESAH
jgi:hypothetical protein